MIHTRASADGTCDDSRPQGGFIPEPARRDPGAPSGPRWRKPVWWFLSTPISVKVLLLCALVAVLFGAQAIFETQGHVSAALFDMLRQRTFSLGHTLAHTLEEQWIADDRAAIQVSIDHIRERTPAIAYILVRDGQGRTVASTRAPEMSGVIGRHDIWALVADGDTRIVETDAGLVMDGIFPIAGSREGTVRVGFDARGVHRQLSALMRSAIFGFTLCAAIGIALGLGLTRLLTQPVRQLVEATRRIRDGDFEARARVLSDDELGQLAVSFNQMAEALGRYRRDVRDKEQTLAQLLGKLVHAQEEERKVIARELHDHLGQSLTALLLLVGELPDTSDPQVAALAPRTVPDLRQSITQRVRHLIDDVRRLAWGVRPSILDDFGLEPALARLAEEVAEHSKIAIDFEASGLAEGQRLPGYVEITLYRIAQEAITNIVRHSGAMRASVVLVRRQDDVRLVVEDNGRGFDVDALRRQSGRCLGLTGIEERVALLGGHCALESTPGKGTTVNVRLPIEVTDACSSVS